MLAALYAHSRRAVDFYVADRKVTGTFGGLAGASAFAGLLAIGLAGGAYATDRRASWSPRPGSRVGYLVLALAIAPGLRAFGAYTAGDFIAARFGGVAGAARLGGDHVLRLVPALRRASEDRRAAHRHACSA